MYKLFFSLLIFSVLLSVPSLSLSIGMAPNVADLGVVEQGSKHIVDAYIITDHERDIIVDLVTSPIGSNFLDPGRARQNYDFVPSEASEQDITSWVKYIENPVLLKTEKKGYVLKDGAVVNANKRATAVLEIPWDAEPGYHACYIEPSPRISAYLKGLGANIITVARMVVVFNVAGDPVRTGYIESFGTEAINTYTERIILNLRNNGTTTLIARSDEIKIYDHGDLVYATKSNFKSISPGGTGTLIANWNVRDMKPGEYEIKATASWTTGETSKEGTITVHERPSMPTGQIIESVADFPYWIIFLGIVIIGLILIYRQRS
ncbi:MAG: hypothetical protein JW754_01385 [Candidatus Aenigmarchaeota archaeon]|nr:hypothetical protein [Candidatus Aenigmarchaeota archaeon]